VKTLTPWDLEEIGVRILCQNLSSLSPSGPRAHQETRRAPPVHDMEWSDPDRQRGYQVFSLPISGRSSPKVRFRSHLDGSEHLFTPELSMEVQEALDSDIVMAFDICTPIHVPIMRLRARWSGPAVGRAVEGLAFCRQADPGARFGIVQGGVHAELRRECAGRSQIGFDGTLGGLAVGEPAPVRWGDGGEGDRDLPASGRGISWVSGSQRTSSGHPPRDRPVRLRAADTGRPARTVYTLGGSRSLHGPTLRRRGHSIRSATAASAKR
jgi:hypothetical protein